MSKFLRIDVKTSSNLSIGVSSQDTTDKKYDMSCRNFGVKLTERIKIGILRHLGFGSSRMSGSRGECV